MDSFWSLFIVFTVYSFIGWFTESIYCSIPAGKFINRGFLNGPFCPIYGLGGVIVVSALTPFQDNLATLYFVGVLITSFLEYMTGFALEKVFHTTYWDYSAHKYNIKGRVCMKNSLLFGVMCVVGILYVNPTLMHYLVLIPLSIIPFISIGLIFYFIFDTIVTVHVILQLNGKLAELQQILDEIKEKASTVRTGKIENWHTAFENLIDDDARAHLSALSEKKNRIETEIKFFQRRMINAFPTMKSIRNNESLQWIKKHMKRK